jgi:hypothetical protein
MAIFIGGNNDGNLYNIRNSGTLPEYRRYEYGNFLELRGMHIKLIDKVYRNLQNIYSDSNIKNVNYFRLRHGFNAFQFALQCHDGLDAILQLTKSIEALVNAREKNKFAEGCLKILNYFKFPKEYSESQIKEIYTLRGQSVHFHLENIVKKDSYEEKLKVIIKRAFIISKFIYQQLLQNEDEFKKFVNSKGISLF